MFVAAGAGALYHRLGQQQQQQRAAWSEPASSATSSPKVRVPVAEMQRLIRAALARQGHRDQKDIDCVTDVLLFAELRGNNQGIVKLIAGDLRPHPLLQPSTRVVHRTDISAKLDGGQKIGMRCVRDALDEAYAIASKSGGVAVVGCSGYSSATGALGYWAREASRRGYIAVVMSMCPEMVAPHGKADAVFGTNPIALGFPRGTPDAEPLVLDMATSSAAWYEVVRAAALGRKLPSKLGLTADGQPTDEPAAILQGGALQSFDYGHKGSHLALFVELLAGAWTGAAMSDKKTAQNWGSVVVLMHPSLLLEGGAGAGNGAGAGAGAGAELDARVDELCARIASARPAPGWAAGQVFLPGQRGDEQERAALREGAVLVEAALWPRLLEAAGEAGGGKVEWREGGGDTD